MSRWTTGPNERQWGWTRVPGTARRAGCAAWPHGSDVAARHPRSRRIPPTRPPRATRWPGRSPRSRTGSARRSSWCPGSPVAPPNPPRPGRPADPPGGLDHPAASSPQRCGRRSGRHGVGCARRRPRQDRSDHGGGDVGVRGSVPGQDGSADGDRRAGRRRLHGRVDERQRRPDVARRDPSPGGSRGSFGARVRSTSGGPRSVSPSERGPSGPPSPMRARARWSGSTNGPKRSRIAISAG